MSMSTVIVTPRVLLREGLSSLLQGTRYKVVATAARPADLSSNCCPTGQQALAIFGINQQNGNLDELAASIGLLRSLLPDGKIVVVAESEVRTDPQRVLALSPDACIFNLGSRDALINILELTFLDQRVFVFAKSIAPSSKEDAELTDSARSLPSNGHHRLGINDQNLSPRESQILTCLVEGNSNKAIARIYNLSEATVKVHLKAILRKINAQNRTQAAIWAIGHGFAGLSLGKALSPSSSLPTDHRVSGNRSFNPSDS
jgi:two-component system, NarL family, nitrate/nitrite response regulator NarL